MKPGPMEDLVGDIYARLYETVVPDLVNRSNTEENRSRMRVDHLLMGNSSHYNDNNNSGLGSTPLLLPADIEMSGLIPVTTMVAKPRTKGINRKEIQRKAEALVAAKPSPITTGNPALVPGPSSSLRLSTHDNTKVLVAVAIPVNEGRSGMGREDVRETGREGSSVPGSLHDSADDESELSDVGAEAERSVMFPGLARGESRVGEDNDEADEDGDVDGDDDGDRDLESGAESEGGSREDSEMEE